MKSVVFWTRFCIVRHTLLTSQEVFPSDSLFMPLIFGWFPKWHLLMLSCWIAACCGYKVLFLAPRIGKSHFLYMSSFVQALLDREHEVTFVTIHSLSHLKLANYTEILIDPPLNLSPQNIQDELIQWIEGTTFSSINAMSAGPRRLNEHSLQSESVQKLINSTGMHFDVIILEDFYADSFLMFAHKFKAPIVTICSYGVPEFIDRQQGLISSPSFVPHSLLSYSDQMSFTERWYNTIVTIYDWFVRNFDYLPAEETTANKYFAQLAPLPSLNEILQNISLTLVNSHRALSPPRPSMPNVIQVGGAHIKPPKSLPNDLKKFLDEAKYGVIYFSLGSVLQSSMLPKNLFQSFIGSFHTLKQRVLWKYENESYTDIPTNVMIRKWMPQNDILAHPNVVLFISHGGMFGTTESLFHGVPLLLIPFYGDQFRNAHQISTAGYGRMLDHREITVNTFTKAISDMISNASYSERAKQISAIFQENLIHPMDEAMFWIEHVAKFNGANHLKSNAVHISWFSYLLIDVVLVNVFMFTILLFVLCIILRKLFKNRRNHLSLKKKFK